VLFESPFFVGSTKEFQNERLKRGLVGGFLANAMPTCQVFRFLQYFTSCGRLTGAGFGAGIQKMGKSRNFNRGHRFRE
jgi:hypothetical protein